MTNEIAVLLYSPFIIISLTLLATHAFSRKRARNWHRNLAFFLAALLWQMVETSFFLVTSPMALEILLNVKTALATIIHTLFIMLLVHYYGFAGKMPKHTELILFTVPALTMLIAFTSPFHSLLTGTFTVVPNPSLTVVEHTRGLWAYVELGYSTILLTALLVALVFYYRQMPKAYKNSIFLHIVSCLMLITGFWMDILAPYIPINISAFAISFSLLLHYVSAVGTNKDSFMQIERSDITDLLDQCIFILNHTGMIISVNASGKAWFKRIGQSLVNVSFKELLIDLEVTGKILRKPVMDGKEEDIYVLNANTPTVYRLERHNISYYCDMLKGCFVTLTDVTRNRILIEQLRDLAGIDTLTGLPNRFRYQEILRTMDTEKNYPLSIIMGDVNGLKTVNDTCGHDRGDQLLADIAKVLVKYCPKNGYVARYGGDEFVVLIPICAYSRAEAYIQKVQSKLKEITGYPVVPGIALGSATKNESHENINALIASADELMYREKRR